jgi:hypothetical protein
MTRRRFTRVAAVFVVAMLVPSGFDGVSEAEARKRKRRRRGGGGASAFAEASVSGPNGRASASVSCGPGTAQQTSAFQTSVRC